MSTLTHQGKIYLVTGAASGIGRATALELADQGADLIVSDRQLDAGKQTAAMIREKGRRAVFIPCDISKEGEVKTLIEQSVSEFGKLDGAFNNAGTEGFPSPMAEASFEHWKQTLDVNLNGTWLCMKYEIAQMLKQGRGSIVNCSSIAGLVGFPGSAAYVASKHAVLGLTKTAALDYAKANLRINAVCPGVIQTPMIERFTKGSAEANQALAAGAPMGRVGRPEEIASGVAWLLSDGASYMNGQALVIDGGWTIP